MVDELAGDAGQARYLGRGSKALGQQFLSCLACGGVLFRGIVWRHYLVPMSSRVWSSGEMEVAGALGGAPAALYSAMV